MKGEDASKRLSDLITVISGLAIIPTIFVVIEINIVYTWNVSEMFVYKLQDLCILFRSILCATFSVLDIVLDILLTNICMTLQQYLPCGSVFNNLIKSTFENT